MRGFVKNDKIWNKLVVAGRGYDRGNCFVGPRPLLSDGDGRPPSPQSCSGLLAPFATASLNRGTTLGSSTGDNVLGQRRWAKGAPSPWRPLGVHVFQGEFPPVGSLPVSSSLSLPSAMAGPVRLAEGRTERRLCRPSTPTWPIRGPAGPSAGTAWRVQGKRGDLYASRILDRRDSRTGRGKQQDLPVLPTMESKRFQDRKGGQGGIWTRRGPPRN
jgi:hypothetical protein